MHSPQFTCSRFAAALAAAVAFGLALVACGGGGGGGSNNASNSPGGSPDSLSLLAGKPGGKGNLDGAGQAAHFGTPNDVAVDAAGNLYVVDSGNAQLRKVSPAGVVSTLAGRYAVSGYTDGSGTAALFSSPTGVAVDASGTIYVVDQQNHAIRKVSPAGAVTTLAGNPGIPGGADGQGAAAGFRYPTRLAVDGNGNVYVSDSGNATVRKITPDGTVSTLAGLMEAEGDTDGTGSEARFAYPYGIVVDAMGTVHVVDSGKIRRISASGVVTTQASSSSGLLDSAMGLALDSAGNFWVTVSTDEQGSVVRKVTPDGVVSTVAGRSTEGYADGVGTGAAFRSPQGIAAAAGGIVYVADTSNSAIRKIDATGAVSTFAGTADDGTGPTDGSAAQARFNSPVGLALDSAGNTYVTEFWHSTIRKIDANGAVSTLAGANEQSGSTDGPLADARFAHPTALAADSSGNIFVADSSICAVRKISAAGTVSTIAGSANGCGTADGTGAAAQFWSPHGIALDREGNLYVTDKRNNNLRKITPAGVVTTLAGSMASEPGSADGTGTAARFSSPIGVAVDSAGNVYVADSANLTIRKVTPAGMVSTLAGTAGEGGSVDASGSAARFLDPQGLAVDAGDNLYVRDARGDTIRKVTPAGVVTRLAGKSGEAGFRPGIPGRLGWGVGLAISGRTLVTVSDRAVVKIAELP